MYDDFVFGKDVFLRTDYPTALDSEDAWCPPGEDEIYHGQPVSFVSDFYSGEEMARRLLETYPGKTRLLDLGTASGSVPVTMRRVGMRALGLDGLDAGKRGAIAPHMLRDTHPSLTSPRAGERLIDRFAWIQAPEIVETCDITRPFRIEDAKGTPVLFDFVYSCDCFEHLVTERVPTLVDNIYRLLAKDGYGIFEVSIGEFEHLHQTIQPREWWVKQFSRRFIVDEALSARDFTYTRSIVRNGEISYIHAPGLVDGYKILFWVRKGPR